MALPPNRKFPAGRRGTTGAAACQPDSLNGCAANRQGWPARHRPSGSPEIDRGGSSRRRNRARLCRCRRLPCPPITDCQCQPFNLVKGQRASPAGRVKRTGKERFIRINIAEAGNNGLIKQECLKPGLSSGQAVIQHLSIKLIIKRLRPELSQSLRRASSVSASCQTGPNRRGSTKSSQSRPMIPPALD